MDLKGHGEVPLSFPRAATSSIVLPAGLEGKTLVEDRRAKAVVAETYKAKGAAVRIAVAPGDYDVLVRSGTRLARCPLTAGPGGATLDLARCTNEAIITNATKGPGSAFVPKQKLEVTVFAGPERSDGYTDTLSNFGFSEQDPLSLSRGISAAYLRQYTHKLWIGGVASYELSPEWKRMDSDTSLATDWSTIRAMAIGRGVQMFAEHGFLRSFGVARPCHRSRLRTSRTPTTIGRRRTAPARRSPLAAAS